MNVNNLVTQYKSFYLIIDLIGITNSHILWLPAQPSIIIVLDERMLSRRPMKTRTSSEKIL